MLADIADRHEIARDVEREGGLQLGQRDEVRGQSEIERNAVRRRVAGGADGDGAIGIKRIKERGGLTIAPTRSSASRCAESVRWA